MFANYISDNGLLSKIYKELLKFNYKQTGYRNGTKYFTGGFIKETSRTGETIFFFLEKNKYRKVDT